MTQQERFAQLTASCARTIQALAAHSVDNSSTTKKRVESEIGKLQADIAILCSNADINRTSVSESQTAHLKVIYEDARDSEIPNWTSIRI